MGPLHCTALHCVSDPKPGKGSFPARCSKTGYYSTFTASFVLGLVFHLHVCPSLQTNTIYQATGYTIFFYLHNSLHNVWFQNVSQLDSRSRELAAILHFISYNPLRSKFNFLLSVSENRISFRICYQFPQKNHDYYTRSFPLHCAWDSLFLSFILMLSASQCSSI